MSASHLAAAAVALPLKRPFALGQENEFATLFDVHYLPRGLVLYESLRRVCPEFHLRVLCMDDVTKKVLDAFRLPSLTAISLAELEAHDCGLAAVRRTRSRVEYCWTAAAPFCLFCLERERGLEVVTYLDADLVFYADPAPVFEELGDGSILVTAHRYGRRWRWLERDSGRYNVQLVTFRREADALELLRWWRERCLEWCYDRVEEGRFGDQRYLDHWPERCPGVRVLGHPGGGLGPWSSGRFSLERRSGAVTVDGKPLLFHHMHGLRLHRPGGRAALDWLAGGRKTRIAGVDVRWSSDFPLTRVERELIWRPYLAQVASQTERVLSRFPQLRAVLEPAQSPALMRRLALRAPRPLPALISRVLHTLAARRLSVSSPPEPGRMPAQQPHCSEPQGRRENAVTSGRAQSGERR